MSKLWLYEEVLLLALRDDEGTLTGSWVMQALAGAVIADLLLEGRIQVEGTDSASIEDDFSTSLKTVGTAPPKDPRIMVKNPRGVGDALIDEALVKITEARRNHPISHWVSWIANTRNFTQRAAQQLVDDGILRSEAKKVLFFFSREVYPELNPNPEREIIARIEKAIIHRHGDVDDHTRILITLARSCGLISHNLGEAFVKEHKERIDELIAEDITGQATQQVIRSAQMALLAATTMTTVIVPTIIT